MKKLLFIVIFGAFVISLMPLAASAATSFTDIENHWSKEYAEWANEQGIMFGTTETKFSPDKALSRAMAITALYRMDESKGVSGTVPFKDVSKNSYYYDAVLWGVENKIINGVSETTFSPNNGVSRQDFAVMLYRFWHYQNGQEWTLSEKPDDFREAVQGNMPDEIFLSYRNASNLYNWYASDAMEWAVSTSIICGNRGGMALPFSVITRAEVVTMLKRYAEDEELSVPQPLISVDPAIVMWIHTYRIFDAGFMRTIENPGEIEEILETINHLTYIKKKVIRDSKTSEPFLSIRDTLYPGSYSLSFEPDGILIGDIFYYTVEEDSAPYSYLPNDWFEKWFES